jgi:signal transduction histidine kinase
MEDIKHTHSYPIFSFIFFICAAVLSIINIFIINNFINILIVICIVLGIMSYISFLKKWNKYLLLLVDMTQNIIEQKDMKIPYIDGEGSIAVLYSHLSILDKRMKNLIETLQLQQNKLKEYIEDISHQIKTPLTSIMLREEMLLEEDENNETLLSIYHSTEKIKELIETLLHLSQVESHAITYQKNNYELEDILLRIEDHLSALLYINHVKLHYSTNDIIYCDDVWMSEAIENIIKNCIEQKEDIDIYTKNYPTFIEIYIHDHGIGINNEDLPHIFERFYKGNSKGVGIGLSLSKTIINDHHGTIEAYNQNGAVFKITLPHKITKSKATVTI